METPKALTIAQEKNLDLIEIAPGAKPPVARIMSFDKYRYQQEKKLKQKRAQQKNQDMKQIQISIREARHDLERKAGRVNEFLSEGRRVEILLTLRGREKANKEWARQKLNGFLKELISPDHKVVMQPKFFGRGITVQIIQK